MLSGKGKIYYIQYNFYLKQYRYKKGKKNTLQMFTTKINEISIYVWIKNMDKPPNYYAE